MKCTISSSSMGLPMVASSSLKAHILVKYVVVDMPPFLSVASCTRRFVTRALECAENIVDSAFHASADVVTVATGANASLVREFSGKLSSY